MESQFTAVELVCICLRKDKAAVKCLQGGFWLLVFGRVVVDGC